jgi:hypothetical protein
MKRLFKLGDAIIVAVAVILTAAFAFAPLLFSREGEFLTVSVTKENDTVKTRYQLSENTRFTVENNGIILTVVIKDGKAYVEETNCPMEICRHSSSVSSRGDSIVCVPGGIVLTVEGGDSDVGLIAG